MQRAHGFFGVVCITIVAFRFVALDDPAKLTETVRSGMKLTTQQAAERLGKSRTAVWRAIKSGKLSAERTESKDFLIDAAELERYASNIVPAPVTPSVTSEVAPKPSVTTDESSRTRDLEIDLATLRERTAQQERRIADLEVDRERRIVDMEKWRSIAENATRLLTDQRERRPWWRRLWRG
jgi:excisionase family DNA binding protein